ncbi:sugar transferase [Alteribacillus sp. HJP-4]|uniref:sugar transferase n=1 Tax=Alteribacillus sp. HJP-4 TaxID=2775394 RepID=UPI0035CD13D0
MAKDLKYRERAYMIKRSLDILMSSILLLLTLPLMLTISLLILITMGKPVYFIQTRPGKNEILFKIRKFRTMNNSVNESGVLLPNNKRLTKVGRIIRKTSLDELPQLINVLNGEMSFVGPRPLLIKYLPFYNEREKKRHEVRPGITGLAQINGRNGLPWDERLELDVIYVESRSIILDFKILFKTLLKVIKKDGINEDPTSVGMLNLDEERS